MFTETEYYDEKFNDLRFANGTLTSVRFYDCEFTDCVLSETAFTDCKFCGSTSSGAI